MTRFFFTVHPGDMMRSRLLAGADIMLVASSCWDDKRQRLRVRRPPADHIGTLSLDSGGFTAAKRWGRYPWTPEQYVEWVREVSRDVTLSFAASMDYACERGVNREQLVTNRERIRETLRNEIELRRLAPDIPWLSVRQGNTMAERQDDVRWRRRLGLLHPIMGIGSICGRGAREAAEVIRFYRRVLPGTRFHVFGLDVRTLDGRDDVASVIESWDSYAWCWPRGKKSERASFLLRQKGETRSAFTVRIAEVYWQETIRPRLDRMRQLPLEGVA